MMQKFLTRLGKDERAATAVEFALIGPAFLTMFFGVMQVGIGMQQYNALRSISADTARYAVINYQRSNLLSAIQLQDYASSVARSAPYGLERTRFTAFVSTPVTQRVSGAAEYQIRVTYRVRTFLGIVGIGDIPMTYTRPIFVLTPP
ncbi:MAG: TadE/TadG family type IV pilus assembly protein [Novosphingobium sp.]